MERGRTRGVQRSGDLGGWRAPVSGQYGRRDEACPVSTGGGTRRVQLVREGREGGGGPRAATGGGP